MRAVGIDVRAGRAMSALRLHALAREKEEVFRPYITYRWKKGFVQKEKLNKHAGSGLPEGRQPMAWLTAFKSVSGPWGLASDPHGGQVGPLHIQLMQCVTLLGAIYFVFI